MQSLSVFRNNPFDAHKFYLYKEHLICEEFFLIFINVIIYTMFP